MKTISKSSILFFLLCNLFASNSLAVSSDSTEVMVTPDGYAIFGYDPVAYFKSGEAMKGSPEHAFEWKNATWLFSSTENKSMFSESPEKYAPQYGGWCAYGMADGYAAETDPKSAWTIHDGKLYLNWDAKVSRKWNSKLDKYLKKSGNNWPTVQTGLLEGNATIYWKKDQ